MRDLPGLPAIEALGPRTWRARSTAGGAEVVVRSVPAEVAERASVLLPVLSALDTPHVVRLLDVVVDDVGWAVLEESAAASLGRLLGASSTRSAGEVVTLGVPLGEALTALHAEGLVHGSVGVGAVLLTARGMPLLGRLWSAQEYLPPPAPSMEGDVRDLALLCRRLLLGRTPLTDGPGEALLEARSRDLPRALTAVLTAALGEDPAERPDAADWVQALRRATVATPLVGSARGSALGSARVSALGPREPDPGNASAPGNLMAPAHPGPGRFTAGRVRRATAVVVAVGCAAAIGWASGARSTRPSASMLPPVPTAEPATSPPTVPLSPTTSPARHWQAVVERLDARRAQAFATGEEAPLDEVWAPGVAGLTSDRAAVADLRARGWVTDGLRHRVTDLEVRTAGEQRVVMTVTDVLAAHRVLDAAGRVVRVVGERGATSYDVVLVLAGGTWRLGSVTPLPTV